MSTITLLLHCIAPFTTSVPFVPARLPLLSLRLRRQLL